MITPSLSALSSSLTHQVKSVCEKAIRLLLRCGWCALIFTGAEKKKAQFAAKCQNWKDLMCWLIEKKPHWSCCLRDRQERLGIMTCYMAKKQPGCIVVGLISSRSGSNVVLSRWLVKWVMICLMRYEHLCLSVRGWACACFFSCLFF